MKNNKYNVYGINVCNEKMLCEEIDQNVFLDKMMEAIIHFTANNIFDKMFYIAKGYNVTRKNGKFIITYNDQKYEFFKASDLIINGNYDEYVFLNDYYRRMGQCHKQSIKYFDLADNLVTGYVNSVNKHKRIIHSWLEKDNLVIDFSHNLCINKEDYYKLMNVDVINVLSREDFISDMEDTNIRKCVFSNKLYCLFRDELVKELTDKKLILKK